MANHIVTEKRKKMMIWTGIVMVLAILVLPMTGYFATGFAEAKSAQESTIQIQKSNADFWREVSNNQTGYSAVKGRESNELIQRSGQTWRQARTFITSYSGWMIGATFAVLALFYMWRGQVELTHPRTGKTVERWTVKERRMHWVTAGLFIVLSITGLSLLYGRAVLIPLFGAHGFSAYADIAKWIHNILGPVFMVALLSMLINWFKNNFFNKVDLQWFKDFGGMISDKHPSAEKLNGGEKMWFWSLAIMGLALCFSGLVLDFPNFDQQRELLQISHIIHVLTGVALISFAFGHIYIGTVGTEGALEGMVTGQVDTAWAKQHHDLWLKELEQQEKAPK